MFHGVTRQPGNVFKEVETGGGGGGKGTPVLSGGGGGGGASEWGQKFKLKKTLKKTACRISKP